MSLAQILADHSRDISASINHTNEMAQDNVDRKANDLEEKFQHVKDAIETTGGEIAGLGGAWHLGRKIYNKYQARRSATSKAREGAQNDNSSATSQAQEGAEAQKAQAVEDAKGIGTAPKQGAPEDPVPGEGDDSFFPDRTTGNAEADDVFRDDPGNLQLKARQAQAKAQPDAETQPDTAQGGDADARVADTEPQDAPFPESDDVSTELKTPTFLQREGTALKPSPGDAQGASQQQLQEAKEQASGQDASKSSANDGAGPQGAEASTEAPSASAPKPAEVDGVKLDSGANSGSGVGGAVDQEAGDLGESGGKGLADLGDSMARKVGTKLAGMGGDGISAGLDAASTALDFLGPIGEGIGLITSLVGLFEGLGHKKKPVEEGGEQASAEDGTATAGVDTQALQKEELQDAPVGTAV